jgi:hypothetical protein
MKTFFKILTGFLIFFLILIVGLNLYFTDDRLKNMILPEIREATGADVQVDGMSLTFFRTFPRFGIELDGVLMPTPAGDTLASIDELLMAIELTPLLRSELSISRLSVERPVFNYHVYPDSTTNIDFLLALADDDPEEVDEDGLALNIPRFTIRNAELNYRDEVTHTELYMHGLDADISLRFAELIESTVDASLNSLSASVDGTNYIQNLSLSLNQTSTVDLENELLTLTEGIFSIRGLALNLTGTVSDWSSDAPGLNLEFASSSDNFGELLRLAPPEFDEHLEGLETRGSLRLQGTVSGQLAEGELPRFDLILDVTNGFLQNPELPDAIEDIVLNVEINNDLATIREFRARAADNTITANGSIERPLDEDAIFSLDLDGDIDLATVSRFYPIEEFGIDQLAGILQANASASGRIDQPEQSSFNGTFRLTEGALRYADVPRPIDNINAVIEANQDRVDISSAGFQAASNQFSMQGHITQPLDEERRNIDLTANLRFDLATIKDFYPIDEDTLTMRGQLEAMIALQGHPDPDQIESLIRQSTIELRNGYIAHEMVAYPLEDLTFIAEATGTRLTISEARFTTGRNSLAMNGNVTNYLSDDPRFDLTFDGNALFDDISAYYSLEPWIQELTGNAVMNLRAQGPAGDPLQIALNGSLEVDNVRAIGDSIPLPVTELSGVLSISPERMNLENFYMMYGVSDISLEGYLERYLGFMEEVHESTETMPYISGRYHSRMLNMDEMIDWDEEADDEPLPIDLPSITADVSARIDSLLIFGMPITEIRGSGRMNPGQLILDEAEARLFEGSARGEMVWNVPEPLRTDIRFVGSLTDLRAEAFFRDTGFMGENSTIHEHLRGQFSAEFDYFTELDEAINPDMTTTDATGSFGVRDGRIENHPIQRRIAQFLQADELRRMNLDEFTATFAIKDTVMTLEDLRLTSDNIGMELEGTMHMINDQIDFKATLFLPERFKRGIASVISTEAAEALQQEDGTLAVPILITGTSENPTVRPDMSIIREIIQQRLRDGAGDVLRRFFRGG